MSKRLLCIDTFGECALGWLMKCQDAGWSVRWFIGEAKNRDIGKGLVPHVDDWHASMDWADLVFLPDNLKYLHELDAYRKRDPKKPIIAPSVEAASWETDRLKGMQVLRRAGIEVPKSREFHDYDAAISFVKREGRAFVSKPCGAETDKALSYVSKSAADLCFQLDKWKRAGKLKGSFLLQEKIAGCEIAAGAWFGPSGFMSGIEVNFEHKKLMPGDTGPNTGEMGTVIVMKERDKLFDVLLKPLEDHLSRIGYVGCIDVNAICDEDGQLWPLEFTMRPGWPAFNIQQSLLEGDPAEWLVDLFDGKQRQNWIFNKPAVGVVYVVPDFPYSKATKREIVGLPIYGLDDVRSADVMLCQVMRGEAPHDLDGKVVHGPALVSAGDYILVATGVADTVHDARRKVYSSLDKISMPGSPFYRDDIGERLQDGLAKCQEHGLAAGISY